MRVTSLLSKSWVAALVTWSMALQPGVSAQPIRTEATEATWSRLLDSMALAQEDGETPPSVVWLSAERLDLADHAAVERWKQRAGVVDIQRLAAESRAGKAARRQVEARWKQWARRVGWADSDEKRERLILAGEQDVKSLDVELRRDFMSTLVPAIETVAGEDCSVMLASGAAWDTLGLTDYTDAVLQQLAARR